MESNEKEIFLPYKGFEDKYLISNYGNVFSIINKKILKHRIDSCGYHMIGVTLNGKRKNLYIHRMVAETFIDNPQNLKYVNHIDENKDNNMVSNLEFCTNSYNNQSIRKKKRDRVKDEDVLYIRRNKLRPCEALRYLHSKGYTVTNKCARLIVNGTSHKKII
jgi:hypothetical protein